MANSTTGTETPWYLRYGFSVRFPGHPALTMDEDGFTEYLKTEIGSMKADQPDNVMATQDADKSRESATDPLVDLLRDLDGPISGPRLADLLVAAWDHDPLATLKLIFHSRSIHLGNASRVMFYRSAGWLAKHHPLTLITNLQWLSRPVIEKDAQKKGGSKRTHDDMVLVGLEDGLDQAIDSAVTYDAANGVSHGYWKDILNILALAANDSLGVLVSPKDVLNVAREKENGAFDAKNAKNKRHELRAQRKAKAIMKFETDAVYRGLHLTIARLFAGQLKKDLAALRGSDAAAKRSISLCAKWAPSHEKFHDRHTYIVSSIAEILHPLPSLETLIDSDTLYANDVNKKREVYLRHVREAYRKSVSTLRKHLDVVERHVSAKTYSKINYDRVPSIAMNTYAPRFSKKDLVRFGDYTESIIEKEARLGGAALSPGTIIRDTRKARRQPLTPHLHSEVRQKVLDGQWNSLVQRVGDLGTLGFAMAVCDVSGSMLAPIDQDGKNPMDSAIGLTLLIAELGKPPFGGTFITFSERPEICQVNISQSLAEKHDTLRETSWGDSTNLVAVFEDLVLSLAKDSGVRQEDMVKRVFVFTNRDFDEGVTEPDLWVTSYGRITAMFKDAGYEMPEVIYWNLAATPSVPQSTVTTDVPGTKFVSGCSQGMLKAFLGSGSFEYAEGGERGEGEEVVMVTEDVVGEGEDGDSMVEVGKKLDQVDPARLVEKATSHRAYAMLEVVD